MKTKSFFLHKVDVRLSKFGNSYLHLKFKENNPDSITTATVNIDASPENIRIFSEEIDLTTFGGRKKKIVKINLDDANYREGNEFQSDGKIIKKNFKSYQISATKIDGFLGFKSRHQSTEERLNKELEDKKQLKESLKKVLWS